MHVFCSLVCTNLSGISLWFFILDRELLQHIHNYTAYTIRSPGTARISDMHVYTSLIRAVPGLPKAKPIHNYTNYTAYTQLHSLYTAYTQPYSLYTAIQPTQTIRPIHNYTAYRLYTAIQPIHSYTASRQLYSLYTTIQPIHNYIQPILTTSTAYTHLYTAVHVTTS